MHLTLFRILALLRAGPANAGMLMEMLRDLDPGGVPSVPAFYRHIRKAEEEGWVTVEGYDEGEEGPGRPSRAYALTEGGRKAVLAHARRLETFTDLVLNREEAGP